MTAEEEAQLGLRRGRSARAASPPLDLPPNRRVKRLDAITDSGTPGLEPSWKAWPSSSAPSEENEAPEGQTPDPREPSLETYPRPQSQQQPNGANGNALHCLGSINAPLSQISDNLLFGVGILDFQTNFCDDLCS